MSRTESTREHVAAIVRSTAKPATVDFAIETQMTMGELYEARLEVRRAGTVPLFPTDTPNVITQQVEILDKVRAAISSVALKTERLTDEWQEVPARARGIWLWRVEPLRPGKANVVVTVQHAGTFAGAEHRWTVEHFPRTVTIEVGWLQSIAGFAGNAVSGIEKLNALYASLAALFGAGAALFAFWRRRTGKALAKSDAADGDTAPKS